MKEAITRKKKNLLNVTEPDLSYILELVLCSNETKIYIFGHVHYWHAFWQNNRTVYKEKAPNPLSKMVEN